MLGGGLYPHPLLPSSDGTTEGGVMTDVTRMRSIASVCQEGMLCQRSIPLIRKAKGGRKGSGCRVRSML